MGLIRDYVAYLAIVMTALLYGRAQNPPAAKENPPAIHAGRFVDVTEKLGIKFKHEASPTSKKYLLETMGGGVALFDYDMS
jgi:hypothetical protein